MHNIIAAAGFVLGMTFILFNVQRSTLILRSIFTSAPDAIALVLEGVVGKKTR
jgi:hypothetical protein